MSRKDWMFVYIVFASVCIMALILTTCAKAATLRVQGTFPSQQNYGTCATPALAAMDSGITATRLHYRWRGNASGEDSVNALPGALGVISKSVPTGAYVVTGWASWSDNGVFVAGCADSIVKIIGGAPSKVQFGARDVAPNVQFRAMVPTWADLEADYRKLIELRDPTWETLPRGLPKED